MLCQRPGSRYLPFNCTWRPLRGDGSKTTPVFATMFRVASNRARGAVISRLFAQIKILAKCGKVATTARALETYTIMQLRSGLPGEPPQRLGLSKPAQSIRPPTTSLCSYPQVPRCAIFSGCVPAKCPATVTNCLVRERAGWFCRMEDNPCAVTRYKGFQALRWPLIFQGQ